MKVTNVETFLVCPVSHLAGMTGGKNWLFVKVETDQGLHGWGEAYTFGDRDRTMETYVHSLARYLVGRSPFNIKHFTQVMYDDYSARRGSMTFPARPTTVASATSTSLAAGHAIPTASTYR